MINRNDRCYCGSGKKYKKCCIDKKKDNRSTSITMDMGEPVAINGFQIDAKGNLVLLKDKEPTIPQSAYLTHSIVRENKKDKVTSNIPITNVNNLSINELEVLNNLEHMFVIDTNTIKQSEVYQSASIVQHFQRFEDELLFINGLGKTFKHDSTHHAEKLALVDLIKYILFELKIAPNRLVGIVTDHDLGNHQKYNSREVPLIEGTELYLPEYISFIYASADKKNENILTQLIHECDKEATKLLKERE